MEEVQNGKKKMSLKDVLVCIGIVIGICVFCFTAYIQWMTYQDERAAVENEERSKLPNFESIMKKDTTEEDEYQEIRIVNNNKDITVSNGEFGVVHIISVLSEDEILQNYCCVDSLLDQKIYYDKKIFGGVIKIRKNTKAYLKKAYETWNESIKNYPDWINLDVKFQSGIFIYFKYIDSGEEVSEYYLIKILEDGYGGVETVENAQEYFAGSYIKLD